MRDSRFSDIIPSFLRSARVERTTFGDTSVCARAAKDFPGCCPRSKRATDRSIHVRYAVRTSLADSDVDRSVPAVLAAERVLQWFTLTGHSEAQSAVSNSWGLSMAVFHLVPV